MSNKSRGLAYQNRKGVLRTIKTYLSRNRLGELLVIKGLISTEQLKFALGLQKETNLPLGQVFIRYSMISRRQLAFILGRQYALRYIAALAFFIGAFTHFADKKAHAGSIKDVPAQISMAPDVGAHFTKVASYPGLFGSSEKRSGNLSAFTKWTTMFARFDRELKNESNYKEIKNWQSDFKSLQGQDLKSMAARVNSLVNRTRYIVDSKNWGKSDYWATPVEFIKRGGDCEDFAIAKYTALRSLGVPEERMRIAIVHDTLKNIPHAVLVVYDDSDTYILDNQNESLVDGDRPGRYRPIFSINRHAWWLHTRPSATIVASAQ